MLVKGKVNVSYGSVTVYKDVETEITKEVYDKISNDVEVIQPDKTEKITEENKILTKKDVKKK